MNMSMIHTVMILNGVLELSTHTFHQESIFLFILFLALDSTLRFSEKLPLLCPFPIKICRNIHYAMLWNFLLSPSFCYLENSTSLQFFPFLIYTFLLFRKHFTSPPFLSQGGVACKQVLIVSDMSKAVGEQREPGHWWHWKAIGKQSEPVRFNILVPVPSPAWFMCRLVSCNFTPAVTH